jgi:peptidoglycan/xylan/chitin deacetylase (PgdA/CDA1 family)
MNFKDTPYFIAKNSRFVDLYTNWRRWVTGSHAIILVYHRIAPATDNWSLRPFSPDEFKNQMARFRRYYEVVSLDKLAQSIKNNAVPRHNIAAITFDDGYRDNYVYAFPILKYYGIPATIFVTTGAVDKRELFWWDKVVYAVKNVDEEEIELGEFGSFSLGSEEQKNNTASMLLKRLKQVPDQTKTDIINKLLSFPEAAVPETLRDQFILSWKEITEMSKNNIEFGSHTVTHPILTKVSEQTAWNEINQSKESVERHLGRKVESFCYPNGDYNPQVVDLVRKAGFQRAVTVLPNPVNNKANVFTLGRIGGDADSNRFGVLRSGLYGDMKYLFGFRNWFASTDSVR